MSKRPTAPEIETEAELEVFAALHHGLQAYTYFMAYQYHKRRKRIYRVVSIAGMGWHIWSMYKHLRDIKS